MIEVPGDLQKQVCYLLDVARGRLDEDGWYSTVTLWQDGTYMILVAHADHDGPHIHRFVWLSSSDPDFMNYYLMEKPGNTQEYLDTDCQLKLIRTEKIRVPAMSDFQGGRYNEKMV